IKPGSLEWKVEIENLNAVPPGIITTVNHSGSLHWIPPHCGLHRNETDMTGCKSPHAISMVTVEIERYY
ncbi:hypothetical protein L9F63_024563, partial [Diploptera punctata]